MARRYGSEHNSSHFPMLLAAGVLWGTGGLFGALLTQDVGISALEVAAFRMLVAGSSLILLLALTRSLGSQQFRWTVMKRILVVGVLIAGYQASYFAAVSILSVGIATLVAIGCSPMIVTAIESFRYRQFPGWHSMVALLCGSAGLFLLLGSPSATPGRTHILGVLLSIAAGLGFALVTVIERREIVGLSPATTVAFGFSVGGLLLLPIVFSSDSRLSLTPASVCTIAALGLVSTAIPYTLYFYGLKSIKASVASFVALLEPITATILAALFLGEYLGLYGGAGAVLICAAIALNRRS